MKDKNILFFYLSIYKSEKLENDIIHKHQKGGEYKSDYILVVKNQELEHTFAQNAEVRKN